MGMLNLCSTPSSHYCIGNIDWFEQALTLHVKDRNGNTGTQYVEYTFQSMHFGGEGQDPLQHTDWQRETHMTFAEDLLINRWPLNDQFQVKTKKKRGLVLTTKGHQREDGVIVSKAFGNTSEVGGKCRVARFSLSKFFQVLI